MIFPQPPRLGASAVGLVSRYSKHLTPVISADPIEDSISVSSDSSEEYQESSDSALANGIVAVDEDTDTDDIQVIEKPQKKRIRSMHYSFLKSRGITG